MTAGVFWTLLLLIAALTLLVVPPLLRPERLLAAGSPRDLRRARLETRRTEAYLALADADLDRRTGKLTEADHGEMRSRLLSEAAEVLRELDGLDDPPADDGPPPASPES